MQYLERSQYVDCIAMNSWMNDELIRIFEEAGSTRSRYLPVSHNLAGETEENNKRSQASRYHGRDSKRGSPDNYSSALRHFFK
jgi:hypothetical protein